MPKVKISEASQKPSDHREKMEAKPRCESPRVEVRKPAFAGVDNEGRPPHSSSTTQSSGSEEAASPHDWEDRQSRDVKANTSPSADDVKERMKAAKRRGPSNPVAQLAHAEAELRAQSAALAKLSSARQTPPDPNVLIRQLARTVDTSRSPLTIAPRLRNETMALYTALQSGDPIDSILNRLIVAMTNTVMQSHGRALETRNPQAIDINLRHAVKGTKAVIELIEAKTRRRGSKQITVGKVNVEAGGQAIVGNVDARKTRRPETRDCCDPPRDHIEETDD